MAKIEELDDLEFIDDNDELEEISELQDSEKITPSNPKKSSNLLVTVITFVIFLLTVALVVLLLQDDEPQEQQEDINASTIIKNIQKNKIELKDSSKLGILTTKAQKLYNSGKKAEALEIYKDIAFFHNSLSQFNLGVANFKDNNTTLAIKNFEKSFLLDDLKFESSLNLALCYKKLKDEKKFNQYLNIADEHLLLKLNTPLFDYYLALVQYYKDMPISALSAMKKYNQKYFEKNKNRILAKIYTYTKDYQSSIDSLSKNKDSSNYYTIGLQYANLGKYELAAKYFNNSIGANKKELKSYSALALVQNKMGLYEDCAASLRYLIDKYPLKAADTFPVVLKIKPSLHDPLLAQKEFKNSLFNNALNRFALIFYFAPYKLFDTKQSSTIIEKGAKEIYIDDIKSAFSYLNQGEAISNINSKIIDGLKLLFEHKVYEANRVFKNLLIKYPNHSILHYNLALTYANIYDFQNAYKHFSKSYALDTHNNIAPYFKAYTAILLNKEYDEEETNLQIQNIGDVENSEQIYLLHKMLTPSDTSINVSDSHNKNTFDIILNLIAANRIGDFIAYKKLSKTLKTNLPKDIVSNIIYLDQHNQNKNIKDYARAIQQSLIYNSLDISPLLYGESFARELYIKTLSMAGISRISKEKLENEYAEHKDQTALLQSLAYSYIYTKEYEKAYKLYNILVDTHNQKDPHTLFLAALASIGANHHANAIALLELTNLENKKEYESRFALGVLYQEAKNFEGAAIQYAHIGNNEFKSKYFQLELKK